MFEEPALPRKKTGHEIGQDLAALSIREIDERVLLLREEIERLDAAKAAKLKTQAAADALFKR
jgi:uncharacterized small protein (DUF1192 family)